jgi:hypothetical protein
MLPGLIEKLNDPKERLSTPARECLGLLGAKVYGSESLAASQGPSRVKDKDGVVSQWETGVKDALSGRAARAKIEILKLLLAMRDDPAVKLPLKPWLASLVNVLEDSDGAVRDQAREVSHMLCVADTRLSSRSCPLLPPRRRPAPSSRSSCSPGTSANRLLTGFSRAFSEAPACHPHRPRRGKHRLEARSQHARRPQQMRTSRLFTYVPGMTGDADSRSLAPETSTSSSRP